MRNEEYLNKLIKNVNKLKIELEKAKRDNSDEAFINSMIMLKEFTNKIGNIHNQIHSLAVDLALRYLCRLHKIKDIENQIKSVNRIAGRGFDLEIVDNNKNLIIGEVKTTNPLYNQGLGSKQKEEIIKDLKRINEFDTIDQNKYFFVISSKAKRILRNKYGLLTNKINLINILEISKNRNIYI